jgi:Skp family chaperone for outer membrane proteins
MQGSTRLIPVLLGAALCATSCQSVYYGAMEKVGVHKRDILVDRVEDARDSQSKAKEEFKDALTLFTEVVEIKGAGGLERKYATLSKAFERSEARAADVRSRIDKIESVSKALFKEWRSELKQYKNPQLRRSSEKQYERTTDRYDEMMRTMRTAAGKMNPVLDAFRDQVLYLKHNLNSRAIASIRGEAAKVQSDVAALIEDMEASISEANAFISEMGTQN